MLYYFWFSSVLTILAPVFGLIAVWRTSSYGFGRVVVGFYVMMAVLALSINNAIPALSLAHKHSGNWRYLSYGILSLIFGAVLLAGLFDPSVPSNASGLWLPGFIYSLLVLLLVSLGVSRPKQASGDVDE